MEAIKFAGTRDTLEASNRKQEGGKRCREGRGGDGGGGGAWEGRAHV